MKVTLEGSPSDIGQIVSNPNAAYNEVRAQLRAEDLQEKYNTQSSVLKGNIQTIKTLTDKLDAERAIVAKLRKDLENRCSLMVAAETKIQRLEYKINSSSSEVIKLSSEQEAQIENLWQSTLQEYNAKPLTFHSKSGDKTVTAREYTEALLVCLATQNKVSAVKLIREATGIPIMAVKNLLENALMAYGCNVGPRGVEPTPRILIPELSETSRESKL